MRLWPSRRKPNIPTVQPVSQIVPQSAGTRSLILQHMLNHCVRTTATTLTHFRIGARIEDCYITPRFIAVGVRIPDSTQTGKAMSTNVVVALSHQSGLVGTVAHLQGDNLYYQFPIPQTLNEVPLWTTITKEHRRVRRDPRAVGLALDGQPVLFGFDAPHTLVCGTTDSGKSELVRTILFSLVLTYPPEDLALIILDPNYDFEQFDNEVHLLYPVARTEDEITWLLNHVNEEYLRRRSIPRAEQVKQKRWVIVVDEADKSHVMGTAGPNYIALLNIARYGRGMNLNLVVATHKPLSGSIGEVISYLDNQFLGRVTRAVASGHIEGGLQLHKLTGRGDFIHHTRSTHTRFQGALVTPEMYRVLQRHDPPLKMPVLEGVYACDLPGTGPGQVGGRNKLEPTPRGIAFYLYHAEVTQAEAKQHLGYRRTLHKRTEAVCAEIKECYQMLKDHDGVYPDVTGGGIE